MFAVKETLAPRPSARLVALGVCFCWSRETGSSPPPQPPTGSRARPLALLGSPPASPPTRRPFHALRCHRRPHYHRTATSAQPRGASLLVLFATSRALARTARLHMARLQLMRKTPLVGIEALRTEALVDVAARCVGGRWSIPQHTRGASPPVPEIGVRIVHIASIVSMSACHAVAGLDARITGRGWAQLDACALCPNLWVASSGLCRNVLQLPRLRLLTAIAVLAGAHPSSVSRLLRSCWQTAGIPCGGCHASQSGAQPPRR